MTTPNHSDVVTQVFARGGWTLSSKEGAGQFCEAVVTALHAADPEWGHLRKSGAQNQFNGHAVDAALYRATGNTADFIYSAGDPDARPSWGVNTDDHYPASSWVAPTGAVVVAPVDPGTPPSPGLPPAAVDLGPLAALLQAHEDASERRYQDVCARTEELKTILLQIPRAYAGEFSIRYLGTGTIRLGPVPDPPG